MILRILLALVVLSVPVPAFALPYADRDYDTAGTDATTGTCVTDTYLCGCDAGTDTKQYLEGIVTTETCQSECATRGASTWGLVCDSPAGGTATLGSGSANVAKPEVAIEITGGTSLHEPNLMVDIPGVDFDGAIGYDEKGDLRVNYLGAYIDGVYRFIIPALTIVAVVMLMVSGMQYILARGNTEQIKKAKLRIGNAIIGLVILLAAYNIAYIFNPGFVRFEPLTIKNVEYEGLSITEEDPEDQDPGSVTATPTTEGIISATSSGHLVVSTNKPYINQDVYAYLLEAANDYYEASENKNGIILKSASRTLEQQASLFYRYCLATGTCSTPVCDPTNRRVSTVVKNVSGKYVLAGSMADLDISNKTAVIAGLVANSKVTYCPHTTNIAVDIWPSTSTTGGFEAFVEDMDLLVKTMTSDENGFCRLSSEPWHFELNSVKVSSACSTSYKDSTYGNSYPQVGCEKWDYGASSASEPKHCCVLAKTDVDKKTLTMCKTGN